MPRIPRHPSRATTRAAAGPVGRTTRQWVGGAIASLGAWLVFAQLLHQVAAT